MNRPLRLVEDFHRAFKVPIGTRPMTIDADRFQLRMRLFREEMEELVQAWLSQDMVGMADALGDIEVIWAGTVVEFGLQYLMRDIFDEIMRSNMSKLNTDGQPIFRYDGKILKGPLYVPPNLDMILRCYAPRSLYPEKGES